MNDPNVMNTITAITAVVGAACGIAGLILGIINSYTEAQHSRVRLKVVPNWAFIPEGKSPFNFAVETINLSEFPVVITEVGFSCHGHEHFFPAGSAVHDYQHSTALPCRLEPHASCTQYYLLEKNVLENCPQFRKVNEAYVRTQCGARVTGTSPALQKIIGRISGDED